MANNLDFKKIGTLALANASSIVTSLLPAGKFEGAEWVALNPRRADKRLGSFKVNVQTGRWADFATNDKGGDLVSLVAYVLDVKQAEAARKIAAIINQSKGDGNASLG